MAGYDDPRFLQQVIEKLQKDVEHLKKSTIPVIAQQRGPTPGWINAGQFGPGPSMKSALHIHNDGNQVGVSPRLTVTDAAGVVRFEAGNLAANGISAAQYGWRANDANHVPIADAIGLSQVMSSLGSGSSTTLTSFTNTTPQVITGLSVTFSLVRTARILILTNAVGNASTQSGFIDIDLDGAILIQGTANGYQWGINGPSTTESVNTSTSLLAGSHTVDMRAYVASAGGTFTFLGGLLFVFLLGT